MKHSHLKDLSSKHNQIQDRDYYRVTKTGFMMIREQTTSNINHELLQNTKYDCLRCVRRSSVHLVSNWMSVSCRTLVGKQSLLVQMCGRFFIRNKTDCEFINRRKFIFLNCCAASLATISYIQYLYHLACNTKV